MLPLLVAVALTSAVPGAYPSSGSRTLTVAGDARVTFRPNQVAVAFVVTASHRDQAVARRQSDEKVRKVLDALLAAGVQARDLTATESGPGPEYRGNEVISYVSTRHVAAVVSDMARVDEALTAAVRAGGQPIGNVTVRHSDSKAFETRARIAAAAVARERAAGIVEALGGKLGLPRTVSESGQPNQGQSAGAIVVGPEGRVVSGFAAVELAVVGQVHVVFDILDAP
jgi:uncharacterized protein YggE